MNCGAIPHLNRTEYETMSRKYLSKWWIAAAILGALLVGRHAHSATIETFAPNDKRSFWIILIDGEIRPDDSLAFKRVVAKNKITDAVVALNSPCKGQAI